MVYEYWLVADQFDRFAEVMFSTMPAPVRPLIKLIALRQVRRDAKGQGLGRLGLAEQRAKFGLGLDWIDSIADQWFLCGNDLSVADIAVAAQIGALDVPITPAMSAEIRKRTNLMRWMERTKKAVA